MSKRTCKDCRFFATELSRLSTFQVPEGMGECRRYAPRGPLTVAWADGAEPAHRHASIVNAFPFVPEDDWCGEIQLKVAEV